MIIYHIESLITEQQTCTALLIYSNKSFPLTRHSDIRLSYYPTWSCAQLRPPSVECDVRNVAEADTEGGAGGEAGAMTAAQMLRLLRRLQPGPGARELKWGFW